MFCKYCGGEVPDHSKFCLSCGKPVDLPGPAGNKDTKPLNTASAPTEKQTQPVRPEVLPNSTQQSRGKYSYTSSTEDIPNHKEEVKPHHISTGRIVGICAAVVAVVIGIYIIAINTGKESKIDGSNSSGTVSTTGETNYYAGNPVLPTEATETSETKLPVVDSGNDYKIDISDIMKDYEKVVVSSFGVDSTAEEDSILGVKQDGDGLIINISDNQALDVRLDNLILKDTDNSVKQTNGISSTVYNFDTATINYMGNIQTSAITAASYKTIDGVPYLLCTIDGAQSLIPFNDITLSAKINPEDITEASKENVEQYSVILISTGTDVKLIDQFQWCKILEMEDGTRLLDVCSKNVNNGEYTRYLTLESNCMFVKPTNEMISGDGITKLGNEESEIDFNNWGNNFPAGLSRKIVDSYLSNDGFIYAYIDEGKDPKYLLYKIPINKVAFLNSNTNIPVGSTKTDLSQYNIFNNGKLGAGSVEDDSFMFNVNENCFCHLMWHNFNSKYIVFASGPRTAEEVTANYPTVDGTIDFSFNLLGNVSSEMFTNELFNSYKYITYKELLIDNHQFYSIIYYVTGTTETGESFERHFELLADKDSVTIKANESSLVLTK